MNKLTAVVAASGLLASPAWGNTREAAFASSADRQASQTSMFAGATYHLTFEERARKPQGRASLAFTSMTRTSATQLKLGQGLQLSGGQTGKPAFFIGGQDIGQMDKRKANLSGGATAAIIGVVALLVVAAVVVADAVEDQRCIGEEGDCD